MWIVFWISFCLVVTCSDQHSVTTAMDWHLADVGCKLLNIIVHSVGWTIACMQHVVWCRGLLL